MNIPAKYKNLVLEDMLISVRIMDDMKLLDSPDKFSTVGAWVIWGMEEAYAKGKLDELEERLNATLHPKQKRKESSRQGESDGEVQHRPAFF